MKKQLFNFIFFFGVIFAFSLSGFSGDSESSIEGRGSVPCPSLTFYQIEDHPCHESGIGLNDDSNSSDKKGKKKNTDSNVR